ncbi:phage tail spike protein [Streptococcus parasanguinis]|uniref:phage tail spike protein n=1 Tax=Streptococcus parasanguinis TaxID=1318 RepID=UPI0007796B31|nr:phage tail spike protein [Streptococcus parasanguinis]
MIYLFNNEERLLKVVRRNAIKSALQKYALTTDNYVSDRLTVEMKALNDDELEKVEYMAIQSMENTHLFHYFYIAQKSTKGEISTFTGVQSGIEELRKTPVFDKRPKNTPAKPVITELLQGTNWQARFVADTTNHSTNFYYTSVFDALKKLCKVWGLEMQFFVEMNSNGIGARYIDFKKKIGEAVGKRVVYGHNALEILKEVERTNIFTALIGRGKGEQVSSAEESGKGGDGYGRKITFEDVVWSKAKGDPLDKPKGQKYLEIPEMTRTYGIKNSDGTMRPKIGFTDFNEEEDPNELIKLTYQTLINSARPQLALKTSSVYLRGVKIGDTIRVVRHDKKLDYDTRIFEITFNRLNDQSSDIKLGDQIGESSSSKVQSVADKAVEEFLNNEFNSFVESLPDFIRTADGFNSNWYSEEDPTKKYPKMVVINDIWYKPDPEHEGHKIMLRWTGEVWEEIIRTYDSENLREKLDQKFAELKQAMDEQAIRTEQQISEALRKSGLGQIADDAKKMAEQAKSEIEAVKKQNQTASSELASFKEKVKNDLDNKPSLIKVTELVDGVKEQFTNITNEQAQAQAEFEKTAQGLKTKLDTISTNFNPDGTTSEKFNRFLETKTAEGISRERAEFGKNYVAKNTYNEKIGEIEQKFNRTDGQLTQFANYKNGLDGQYATITKQLSDNQTAYSDFKRTSDTFVQTFGTTGDQITNNISRMVLNNQMFQTEVGKISNVNAINLLNGSKGPFKPNKQPANFDNNVLYKDETSIFLEQGQEYTVSAKTDGNFTALHIGNTESDNVLLWLMDDKYQNYQIVSDLKTGTTGTKVVWNKPSGTYRLRVNTYHKDPSKLKSVWEVKIEKGNNKTDYSPSIDDQLKINSLVEAVKTQVTQLNNSYSFRNLNSAGDVLGQLNLNPDGSITINEGLLSIGEKTYIKDGVIKGAMIGKAQIDTAHIKEIDASQANIFNLNVNNINGLNAEFIKAKIEYALVDWLRGKKISALNDKTVIDLNEGTINLFSNTGTIRRIDNTSSSQFLKMTRSGFIAEHFRDPNSAMIVLGTNHDKTENTNNATFAGTRLWSGSGNGVNESFYELVADRIAIYSNGKYRSPWLIHNNTEDGNTYLIPMNENGVKHNLGRGDKHFSKAYIDDLFIGKGSQNVGGYLWDILTCFGIIARYGWDLKNGAVQNHIKSNLINKYGFK